ncbi:hypothetical protein ABZ897_43710 [Nonomuraea sp. NPDC046802]|uniref:hypothetical protein n=1 Tax=Nonomuraea sp. NPDC046802 TaxID=3154919 RepID=UPI003405F138
MAADAKAAKAVADRKFPIFGAASGNINACALNIGTSWLVDGKLPRDTGCEASPTAGLRPGGGGPGMID